MGRITSLDLLSGREHVNDLVKAEDGEEAPEEDKPDSGTGSEVSSEEEPEEPEEGEEPEEEDMEKAEGSRGGHVIGHDGRGKPIYGSKASHNAVSKLSDAEVHTALKRHAPGHHFRFGSGGSPDVHTASVFTGSDGHMQAEGSSKAAAQRTLATMVHEKHGAGKIQKSGAFMSNQNPLDLLKGQGSYPERITMGSVTFHNAGALEAKPDRPRPDMRKSASDPGINTGHSADNPLDLLRMPGDGGRMIDPRSGLRNRFKAEGE